MIINSEVNSKGFFLRWACVCTSRRRFVNFNFVRETDIFGVKASGYYVLIRETRALSKENRISHETEHNSPRACVRACERDLINKFRVHDIC